MPSLFHAPAVDAVFNRIYNLRPETPAQWGTMSAATMFQHCRIVSNALLHMKPAQAVPTLKQRIVRNLILGGLVKIPRGRRMPKPIAEQMQAAGIADFETERSALMHAIEAFSAFSGVLNGAHPHFGRMSHSDWGRFAWVHLDHHLRQFGV
jgi:hypothetical protein